MGCICREVGSVKAIWYEDCRDITPVLRYERWQTCCSNFLYIGNYCSRYRWDVGCMFIVATGENMVYTELSHIWDCSTGM